MIHRLNLVSVLMIRKTCLWSVEKSMGGTHAAGHGRDVEKCYLTPTVLTGIERRKSLACMEDSGSDSSRDHLK